MSKEFAAEEGIFCLSTGDCDKGLPGSGTVMVNGLGDKFFSCSTFAEDENGCIRRSDAVHIRKQAMHAFGIPNDDFVGSIAISFYTVNFGLLQVCDLAF